MARKKSKRQSLKSQLQSNIYKCYRYGKGVKRHDLKKQGKDNIAITSNNTYKQYTRHVTHFADWCKTQNIKSMYQAEKNAPRYLAELEQMGKANTTIKTYKSALSKCFGYEIDYQVKPCNRADVTNNRGEKEWHKHLNESNYQDATRFIDITGCRKTEIIGQFYSIMFCFIKDSWSDSMNSILRWNLLFNFL